MAVLAYNKMAPIWVKTSVLHRKEWDPIAQASTQVSTLSGCQMQLRKESSLMR